MSRDGSEPDGATAGAGGRAGPEPDGASAASEPSRPPPTEMAAAPYEALGEDACAELRTLARPFSRAVVAAAGFGPAGGRGRRPWLTDRTAASDERVGERGLLAGDDHDPVAVAIGQPLPVAPVDVVAAVEPVEHHEDWDRSGRRRRAGHRGQRRPSRAGRR